MISVNKLDNRIVRSFDRAASSYDEHSELQRETASMLIGNYSPEKAPRLALDIGSGTGHATKFLRDRFPTTSIIGGDISIEMTRRTKNKVTDASVAALDFAHLPFKDRSIDLITSSLAYQWARDLQSSLKEAHRLLVDGGELIFSTLASGTLCELHESIKEAAAGLKVAAPKYMDFLELKDIRSSIMEAGFSKVTLNSKEVIKFYSDEAALLKSLKKIGASHVPGENSKALFNAKLLKSSSKFYLKNFPGTASGVKATYNIVWAKCER